MKRLVFSPAARRDLERIANHVADAAGPAIAAELLKRIRARCVMLAETPGEIGTVRPEILEGIRSFPMPPYVLFFRYGKGELQVARVLHERQDVGRHLGSSAGRLEVPDDYAPLTDDVIEDFDGRADQPDH